MTNDLALRADFAAIEIAGYEILEVEDYSPAIRCASVRLEVYSAPSWARLAHYAMNYQLCPCGRH
jgi:hypothetical protein